MYLSQLMIDVGANPDRPRPGRRWLCNVYHVHQRLCMAFPSREQREIDPQFLRPFDPAGFERPHFLFRIDNSIEPDSPRAMILVQSDVKPDWDYAFQNARMFLAANPETREYRPAFAGDGKFRFRIQINLSKKSPEHRHKTSEKTDALGRPRTQGKRVSLTWDGKKGETPDDAIQEWFALKGVRCGFELCDFRLLHLGWVTGHRPSKDRQLKFRSALLEGMLTVADAATFARSVASGIGSAKAFGFGLLSVVPF